MPVKISARFFFVDRDKIVSKFIWKGKGTKGMKTTVKRIE